MAQVENSRIAGLLTRVNEMAKSAHLIQMELNAILTAEMPVMPAADPGRNYIVSPKTGKKLYCGKAVKHKRRSNKTGITVLRGGKR